MARIQLASATTVPEADNVAFGGANGLINTNMEEISFENLDLVETRSVNDILVHGYYYAKEAWFTRLEIGQALEYADPQNAILIIHQRHKDRLDKFSRGCQIDTTSGKQYGYVYSFRGVFEICRWSTQPKANMVMDALYDMAQSVMEQGYFSLMPDSELIELLKNKVRRYPNALNCINKQKIEREVMAEKRRAAFPILQEAWKRQFIDKTETNDMAFSETLREVCRGTGDAFYSKYNDLFWKAYQKAAKGKPIEPLPDCFSVMTEEVK